MQQPFLSVMFFLLVLFQSSSDLFVSAAKTGSNDIGHSRPELVLQTGHIKVVEALAFSPDNRWVASGSFDNTIKIWDVESGRELRSLTGHSGAVKSLACSPDGKWLVSGGNDNTVRIWEVQAGKGIRNFADQDGSIDAVAFSRDGKTLASGGSGGKITVRDAATGQEIGTFSGHTASVSALTFSPDGRSLASGSADRTVKIWDLVKQKPPKTLNEHTEKISVLRFDEKGENLASGSQDKTVILWKTASGSKLAAFRGHSAEILALNFNQAEKLMSADAGRSIKIWNTTGKRALIEGSEPNQDGEAESAVFSPDGTFLATGNGDGTATVSDTKTGKRLATLENHTSGFYGVAFSSDRRWLASASFDNTVKLWDLQTGDSLSPLKGHTGRVNSVVFHPDNTRIMSGSLDHTIRVWDTLSRKSLEPLRGHTNSISSLAVGGKGKLLVSGSLDQNIGLWNMETNSLTRFLRGHSGEVISVAISPDEQFVASASMDATIKIWDARTGGTIHTIEPRSGEIDTVAFSPDGKLIAAGGADRVVRIWESETARLVRTLPGHAGKVLSVSFSPDGKQIVSSSQDKTVRLWSVSDGRAIRAMNGHAGTVFSASISTDGGWLASASDDGTVIIWNRENGERLSTLISLKNSDDWLVVTPEGFFDGSPASWEQLSWRFEQDTFNVRPVEVFFSEFYVPGLLADLLNNRKLPSNSNISNRDRRQPELRLTLADVRFEASHTSRELKVKIDVSRAPAGAKDLRLFRNGALVRLWRGDVLKGQTGAAIVATVPLVAGENRLTAYAFNSDDVKSRDAVLTVAGAPILMRKGTSYILAVGVNEYANSEYNLNQAVADARDFADELKRQQAKLGNSDRVDITILPDQNATKANIMQALADLSAKIQPEDWLTIFFAGHGIAKQNRFYLVPHDLGYSGSRTQQDDAGLQTILAHSISDEELDRAVEGIDARQLVLVIDACNSGQALEAEEKRRGPMNSKGLAQLAYEKGMYILTASQSYQAAKEDARLGHGYLTYALVEEGLKTNAADRPPKDGQIVLREWLDFATERVPQIDQEEINKGRKLGRQLEREKGKAVGQAVDMSIQRPRVFYRRQAEIHPLVVARP